MGTDLAQMIERFSKGIEFTTTKDQFEQDFGMVQVPFGKVTSSLYVKFPLEL